MKDSSWISGGASTTSRASIPTPPSWSRWAINRKRRPVDRDRIVDFLRDEARRPLRARELGSALGVSREEYRSFRRLLDRLETDGIIVRQHRGRYAIPEQFDLVAGRLQTTRKGDGFVIPDEAGEEDVFVPARLLASAVDGDRVLARIEKRPPGRNPAGRVVRVVERAWARVAGIYHRRKGYGVVVPIEPDLGRELLVPAGAEAGANEGDVVAVEIDDWGEREPSPVAHVERVLGRQGDPGVDVLAIVVGHQLPLSFPEVVESEATKVARRGLRPEDIDGRLDLRDRTSFTIDPADARDHDDALHVTVMEDGAIEVGVHIADVGWYVKPGSAIDREAVERATSVYLVDRVIPMLPEALSSGLCSLVPDEDRLTVSVIYRYSAAGDLLDARPARTVIRSRHRLSYEEAERLRVEQGDDPLSRDLRKLSMISKQLRQARADRGSIDFALPETAVEVDEEGRPVRLRPRPRLETHRIVEDFMVKTNEVIAELSQEHGLPVLYRIHEPPSEDRLDNLRRVAGVFDAPIGDSVRPGDVARLIEAMAGRPQEFLVSTVALRSMKQARYAPRNVGHFGLGSEAYLHFTSPIRRYPDLVVHRSLVRHLAGKPPTGGGEEDLERLARHTSERERRAAEAERDSVELKKIEYMTRHLGDEFRGTISGVTGFGLFVLLDEVLVEGLIRVSSLVDDYYHYDESAWSLTGRRSGRRLRLGDRVRVQLARVDPESREIDLELLAGPLDPAEDRD